MGLRLSAAIKANNRVRRKVVLDPKDFRVRYMRKFTYALCMRPSEVTKRNSRFFPKFGG